MPSGVAMGARRWAEKARGEESTELPRRCDIRHQPNAGLEITDEPHERGKVNSDVEGG